jgi:hypothetical protein
MRRLFNWTLVASFVGILAAPAIGNVLGADGADPFAENRDPKPFPVVSRQWADIKALPYGLDLWFVDHFAFRSALVRWHGITRYLWLGTSPTPSVALARRGWLFYADDGGLEDFTNQQPLTDPEIELWRKTVARAKKWCAANGVAYVFTIAPDKGAIYPELFPETVRRVGHLSRTDQIITATTDLGADVDVRPALLADKPNARLFQKTDTHWNPRGAYVAASTIINALRLQNPAIPAPLPLADYDQVVELTPAMDLAGMMGLRRVLGEENITLVPKAGRHYVVREPLGNIVEAGEYRIVTEIPGSTLPRAIVFRDSFTSAMAPFLSEQFSRVVYLWRNDMDVEEVQKEHADVVIQEIVSRHTQWFIPSPELIPDP